MLAFFISPHGYGHAARACAVMGAILRRRPQTRFRIFTTVPPAFFKASLPAGTFTYHRLESDVGLVQKTPLAEDIAATRRALARLYPPSPARLNALAEELQGCRAVLCDISPLGIAAARRAGLPSVLIENFTWDWIYRHYGEASNEAAPSASASSSPSSAPPRLGYAQSPLIDYAQILEPLFAQADFHIQTRPLCAPHPAADVTLPPIARRPQKSRRETRAALGVPLDAPMLLLSLSEPLPPAPLRELLHRYPRLHVLLPGGEYLPSIPRLSTPPREACYHPNLVAAADFILAKAGYSTVAEAYHAGVPFAYLSRPQFPETPVLAAFIEANLGGLAVPALDWAEHTWPRLLGDLLSMPRREPRDPNGAEAAAKFVLEHIAGE